MYKLLLDKNISHIPIFYCKFVVNPSLYFRLDLKFWVLHFLLKVTFWQRTWMLLMKHTEWFVLTKLLQRVGSEIVPFAVFCLELQMLPDCGSYCFMQPIMETFGVIFIFLKIIFKRLLLPMKVHVIRSTLIFLTLSAFKMFVVSSCQFKNVSISEL